MSASQRRIHTVAYLAAATLLASGSLGIAASAANAATAPASTTAEGAKTASQAPTNRSLHPRKASKGRLAVKVSGLPASTNSRVVVSGTSKSTKRYLETLTGSAQLTNLRAGQYRVHAYGTTVGDATYSPKTAIKSLTVKRSGTTRYTVKYKKVARDCTPGPYKNLTNCDFSAQALDNANFAKSTLTNASFAAASVRGANFGMANLTGVDFSNSLLARASFNGAKLANATLANVELTQASFLGASSGGVIGRPLPTDCGDLAFNCPRFDDVYNGYIIATGVNLQGADLADIDLSPWSNLQGVDFTDADLTGANLRGSGVQSAIFVRTKLNSAILDQTAAQYANFNGADLTAANINHFYACVVCWGHNCEHLVPRRRACLDLRKSVWRKSAECSSGWNQHGRRPGPCQPNWHRPQRRCPHRRRPAACSAGQHEPERHQPGNRKLFEPDELQRPDLQWGDGPSRRLADLWRRPDVCVIPKARFLPSSTARRPWVTQIPENLAQLRSPMCQHVQRQRTPLRQ